MNVYIKYLILVAAFIAASYSLKDGMIGAGVTAAGAFIAYAMIENRDLKTLNEPEEEEKK